MGKVWRYLLRSAWLRSLCLLILSLTILLNTSIDSFAAVSSGTTKSVSVTYNNSANNICIGNTYLPWNYNIESQWLLGSNYDYEKSNFWYKGTNQKLFDSEAKYYGYSVKITRTSKTSCQFTNASANYWVVGTATQLMNGENRGGVITSTSYTAWVPTENSIQAVHMAPFFYFNYLQMPEGDWVAGEYDINCIYYVTYTGYETKDDYTSAMSNIQNELEHQTTELESQTQELQDQTVQLEEQTETQKGIFASIQEFFGSFFQNLIDSVVGLFVPSSEEMSDLFDRLNTFFADTFGFLYYPFDVFVRCITYLMEQTSGSVNFTFPGFSIMGYQVWNPIKFSFNDYPILATIFKYVRQGSGVVISFLFINYLRRFFDKRFGGGGD